MLEESARIVFSEDLIQFYTPALLQLANRCSQLRRSTRPMNAYMDSPDRTVAARADYSVTSPAPRAEWQEIYHADAGAMFHQSAQWIAHLCDDGGFEDISRLYELENGKRLVLPLVKRRGIPTSLAFAESLPYAWGLGGILASHPLEAHDVAAVFEDLMHAGYLGVNIRPNPLQGEVWAAAKPAGVSAVPRCAHVLDLSGGFDEVWANRFTSRTRNYVRRAERAELEIECDTTGRLVPVHYELYERSLVRWATQQNEPVWLARLRAQWRDPQHKLHAIAEQLGSTSRVCVAWHKGQPVASIMILQDRNCSYTLGAMNKELAATTYANYLLHRLAIEDACNAGCRYYDMGESGMSEPLARFKRGFGAGAVPYADYHIERLPLTHWDRNLREAVKRLIGFNDV